MEEMLRIMSLLVFALWNFYSVTPLSISNPESKIDTKSAYVPEPPKICNTPGCVKAAYTLIQNMDSSAEPCEDFYQYACGGFHNRVSIFVHIVSNF